MEARANAIMDQVGPYAGKKISAEDLGDFKASQVRNVFHFSSLRILSNFFEYAFLLQSYNSTSKVGVSNLTCSCPLAYTTGCKVCLQVRNRPTTIELWSSGQHTLDSHATDRSAHLTHAQRVGVQRAVSLAGRSGYCGQIHGLQSW
jgi:hypothetical protein